MGSCTAGPAPYMDWNRYFSYWWCWTRGMLKLGCVATHGTMVASLFEKITSKHFGVEFSLFLRCLHMWAKVQKSRPNFTPVTLGETLKVIGPARWNRPSKCWILSIISIFDLEMTFKVTSGWTGSRIFELSRVDIPIQCLTSVTLGRQIRALRSWAGPV